MTSFYLPYRHICYETDLTSQEIQQLLSDNILIGFSFVSPKAYYGYFSNYDFAIRKAYSNTKKESLRPTITGHYKTQGCKSIVTISIIPHLVLIIGAGLFGFPCLMFLINGLVEFLHTWETVILVNCVVPVGVLYGLFWIIFQYQSSADLRYWEYTLSLRNVTINA